MSDILRSIGHLLLARRQLAQVDLFSAVLEYHNRDLLVSLQTGPNPMQIRATGDSQCFQVVKYAYFAVDTEPDSPSRALDSSRSNSGRVRVSSAR